MATQQYVIYVDFGTTFVGGTGPLLEGGASLPETPNGMGDRGLYALAIREVLADGDISGAFEALRHRFSKLSYDDSMRMCLNATGWRDDITAHTLDFLGLAIAKIGSRRGANISVDTDFIPRRLYTEELKFDPYTDS